MGIKTTVEMVTVSGCCCFSLKTGSKILGWLGIAGSILSIIFTISLMLSDTDGIMENIFSEYKHYYEVQELLDYYYNHKPCKISKKKIQSTFKTFVMHNQFFLFQCLRRC